VLIDTDPAFTQIRHISNAKARALALSHTAFFSFGENIGRSGCSVPDDGLPWQPTRQPVVLNAWQADQGRADGQFTTVMLWDSYDALEFDGRRYGMKSESFAPYLDLPQSTGLVFTLAIGSPSVPRELLSAKGWNLCDARMPTLDLSTYQKFIRQSKAEFSVAKHGYVVSHSGWFSERSASYLASGRPVVVQQTGFNKWLPGQAGVFGFNTPEEALSAIEAINSDYDFHCRAAREIAGEYFDSRRVLLQLLEGCA